MRAQVPQWAEKLPYVPALVHAVLKQAHDGKLRIEWKADELEKIRREIKRSVQRTFAAVVGAAFIVSAAVVKGLDDSPPVMLANAPLLTWLLGGMGLLIVLLAWPDDNSK